MRRFVPRCRRAARREALRLLTPYNPAMRILIANDDGYLAPGLQALVQACSGLGEIDVVAPEQNASGTSNSLTLSGRCRSSSRPTASATSTARRRTASTWRSPGLLPQRPDLVLSGINNGANMGDDTLYSGTVAAAMEGFLFGIPAIAFSLVDKGWRPSRRRSARGARPGRAGAARATAAAPPWLLNVNIPNRPDADRVPVAVTRLGRRHASEPVIRQTNPRGEPIYWIGPAGDAREAGEGTDFHATALGAGLGHAAAGRPDRSRRPGRLAGGARRGRARGMTQKRGAAPRFPLRLDRLGSRKGRRRAPRARCCGRRRRCSRPRPMPRVASCPPGWASIRRKCAAAWWHVCAQPGCATRRCSPRWPTCRAICSSTARSSTRPTKTRACRSATGRRSPSLRSSAA